MNKILDQERDLKRGQKRHSCQSPDTRTTKTTSSAWYVRPAINIIAVCCYFALKCFGASWQIQLRGRENIECTLARGEKIIAAFWHQQYLPLFIVLRDISGCTFTSDSFRGRVIQRLCRMMGIECKILSADHACAEQQLLNAAMHYPALALAIDGPLGPYHVAKTGAIRVASMSHNTIVPVVCRGRRQWLNKTRWDKFAIPAPFTHIVAIFDQALTVPTTHDKDLLHDYATQLTNRLLQLEQEAQTVLE